MQNGSAGFTFTGNYGGDLSSRHSSPVRWCPNLMGNKEKRIARRWSAICGAGGALDMWPNWTTVATPIANRVCRRWSAADRRAAGAQLPGEGGCIRRLPQDPWGNDHQLLSPDSTGQNRYFSVAGPDECRTQRRYWQLEYRGKIASDSAASRYWK